MNEIREHPVLSALRRIPLQDALHEAWIASRLAAQLPEGECEVPHPSVPAACDVRFRNGDGTHTWLVLARAQSYFSQQQPARDHREHFEELLLSHSVRDVREKLASLVRPCRAGFALVLGYHEQGRLALPVNCLERFRQLAGLDGVDWHEHHAGAWRNPSIEPCVCVIDVYYWERALLAVRGSSSG